MWSRHRARHNAADDAFAEKQIGKRSEVITDNAYELSAHLKDIRSEITSMSLQVYQAPIVATVRAWAKAAADSDFLLVVEKKRQRRLCRQQLTGSLESSQSTY